jgi:hypothetical protein
MADSADYERVWYVPSGLDRALAWDAIRMLRRFEEAMAPLFLREPTSGQVDEAETVRTEVRDFLERLIDGSVADEKGPGQALGRA